MARLAAFSIAVCLFALAGLAAAQSGGLTCEGAKALGTSASDNLCCPLCYCLGNQSKNKVYAAEGIQKMCKTKCSQCVEEAQTCAKGADLPAVCKQGLQFNQDVKDLVDKCVGMYRADKSSITRVLGC